MPADRQDGDVPAAELRRTAGNADSPQVDDTEEGNTDVRAEVEPSGGKHMKKASPSSANFDILSMERNF